MKRPGKWYTLEEGNKLKEEYYCTKCHYTIETRKIDITTKLDPYKEEKSREIRIYTCSCGEIYVYAF